tara:strand:- start:1006 stop:1272 length:267 start_codon:yes stop_codon:yes gene_type:complete
VIDVVAEPSLLERMEVGVVWYATQKSLNGIRRHISMMDDRYITEEYDGGIRITMKVYKEWVSENGEPQVFHKTDTVGFVSPLVKEDYE